MMQGFAEIKMDIYFKYNWMMKNVVFIIQVSNKFYVNLFVYQLMSEKINRQEGLIKDLISWMNTEIPNGNLEKWRR